MPRGKFVNHKGRCRQFTPADELQQEIENGLNRALSTTSSDNDNEDEVDRTVSADEQLHENETKRVGVEALIEISNPNRVGTMGKAKKTVQFAVEAVPKKSDVAVNDKTININPSTTNQRRDRDKQRDIQKTNETKADLARLALIRKEREEAAERRLAAKSSSTGGSTQPADFLKVMGSSSNTANNHAAGRKKGRKGK